MPLAVLPHHTIRALGPDDRDALAVTFARMSPESRRRRFLGPKPTLSERELTLPDRRRPRHPRGAGRGRRNRREHRRRRPLQHAWARREGVADLAVAVIDDWQGRRLGTRLAIQTIQHAKLNGFSLLTGTTFWDNRPARRMMRTLGFNTTGYDGALLDMELRLG
jgi:GNAT superfamily N-acetyltransferase